MKYSIQYLYAAEHTHCFAGIRLQINHGWSKRVVLPTMEWPRSQLLHRKFLQTKQNKIVSRCKKGIINMLAQRENNCGI
jgi:hypothetical protein